MPQILGWELKTEAEFFRPHEAEIAVLEQFDIALGNVRLCVPWPKMLQSLRAI